MPEYIRPAFSPSFYAADLSRNASSSPVSSPPSSPPASPRPQAASRLLFFGDKNHGTKDLSEMMALQNFPACQGQYTALLDRFAGFVDTNADRVQPVLTDATKTDIKSHIDLLKDHLTNQQNDFFGRHKPVIYGSAKELFHKLDDQLADSRLPVERRMLAVQALAPSLGTCAGGVVTAVQKAVSELRRNVAGVKGAAYYFKVKMIQALIQEHVRTTHKNISPGNEVHYVNAYFNHIAADMGEPEQADPFIDLGKNDIGQEQFEQCRKAVLSKMKPGALATVLADTYLDRIKAAVGSAGVSAGSVLAGDDVLTANNTIHDAKLTALDAEFGDVPIKDFLKPVDDAYDKFEIARHPIEVARHFMGELKKSELVDYNDAVAVQLGDGRGKLVVLDNLMWRDNDGQCTPVGAADLLEIAPGDLAAAMSAAPEKTPQERHLVFKTMITEVFDAAGQKSSLAHLWMAGCATQLQRIDDEDEGWAMAALLAASFQGQPETVKRMVEIGAKVNMQDAYGWTATMFAASKGHAAVVDALIKGDRTTINMQDAYGWTATMFAASKGHAAVVDALIKGDRTTINLKNRGGNTAAMFAASRGYTNVLDVLIKADRTTIDKKTTPDKLPR